MWSSETTDTWMQKPYRLADALSQVCDNLSVKIASEGFKNILSSEKSALQLPGGLSQAYVRSVFLVGDNKPLCYARIVVPAETFQHYEQDFKALGTQFLGDTLLYGNPKTTRSAFEFTRLDAKCPVYQNIADRMIDFPGIVLPDDMGARRSVFQMDGVFPLLVMEVFLNKIALEKNSIFV